jgi:hypothetical protein
VSIAFASGFLNSRTDLNQFRKILNSRLNCSIHVPPSLEKPALWLLFAGVKPIELRLRLISRAGRAPFAELIAAGAWTSSRGPSATRRPRS